MLRYLRIACSASCAIACIMLIALWLRSYWRDDFIQGPVLWRNGFSLTSTEGRIMIGDLDAEYPATTWDFGSIEGSSQYAAPKVFLGPVFAFYPSEEEGAYIHVPHWFPALIAGVVAVVLAKRRRFSLRSLLIAMTLIAIGLAAISYYATHADPGGSGGGWGGGGGGLAAARGPTIYDAVEFECGERRDVVSRPYDFNSVDLNADESPHALAGHFNGCSRRKSFQKAACAITICGCVAGVPC